MLKISPHFKDLFPTTAGCPANVQLVARIEERLKGTVRKSLDSHVEQCLTCQQRLNDLVGNLYGSHELSASWTGKKSDSVAEQTSTTNVLNSLRCRTLPKPELDRRFSDDLCRERKHLKFVDLAGEGGMAVVFRCRDKKSKKDVAVKVLRHHYAENPAIREQFRREAQIQARLAAHVGVADVFETGKLEDGRLYTMMAYCKGRTLSQRMKVRRNTSAVSQSLVDIFRRACEVVAYAHKQGIRHRDLKPSNIHVSASGAVTILDWGLAHDTLWRSRNKDGDNPANEPTADLSDSLFGTPGYIAPEQISGATAAASADVYSLGVILSEVLTGQRIGTEENVDVNQQEQQKSRAEIIQRVRACKVEAKFVDLIERCLATNPEERPQDAAELLVELDRVEAPASVRWKGTAAHQFDVEACLPPPLASLPGILES